MDFSNAPIVVIADFTEGEIYKYDFTGFASILAGFMAFPNGAYFNAYVRPSAIPYVRL